MVGTFMQVVTDENGNRAVAATSPSLTCVPGDNKDVFYWMAWADPDEAIWIAAWAGAELGTAQVWPAFQKLQGADAKTSKGPSITQTGMLYAEAVKGSVLANSRAMIAWKGSGTDPKIYISIFNSQSNTWIASGPIKGIGTSAGPVVAATVLGVTLAFKGERDDTLYFICTNDGQNWSHAVPIPGYWPNTLEGSFSTDTPALTGPFIHNNTLGRVWSTQSYMAFKGSGNTRIYISLCVELPGYNWYSPAPLPETLQSEIGPALAVVNGVFYLVLRGMSDHELLAVRGAMSNWQGNWQDNTISWQDPLVVSNLRTRGRPALTSGQFEPSGSPDQDPKLALAIIGETSNNLYFGTSDMLSIIELPIFYPGEPPVVSP
jgi:hypothetical protein